MVNPLDFGMTTGFQELVSYQIWLSLSLNSLVTSQFMIFLLRKVGIGLYHLEISNDGYFSIKSTY